ncbi:hypothetical protein [Halogeometricum luteum]|uniref:Uncharacterized protein n=1 Tax=Halogeometricum luteum TaxID=2950537 RepID=A0ABU2G1K9_9EURY|nr:hypothetical protein [Halogeometricum sp. S3BR5-2]MDS0294129.1 hypothetical protein [Halogeometricum sp. S3BR5-2]
MSHLPRAARTSLKTEAWTSAGAAAVFFVFGGLHVALFGLSPTTLLTASLVPVPLGAQFALGQSSRRVVEVMTNRGVRFLFTLSFSLSLVFLALGGAPGVRLGVVSFLLGVGAGNYYLYAVAGVEYAGEEGGVSAA